MNRTILYHITQSEDSLRVEQYLRRRGYSRPVLTELKKPSGSSVTVNGRDYRLNQRLSAGDELKVALVETASSGGIVPVNLPLHIVYEDLDILVVDKPAGMPTHPSANHDRDTLANAVMYYYESGEGTVSGEGGSFVFRCGNRLDQDTSGITVIAKNMLSSAVLSSMTAGHQVYREYLGIVRGTVSPSEGTIDAPLGRKMGPVIERVVDWEHGEPAITHYRLVEEGNGHSLVAMELETGRTHQIRIHMKHLGFPLVGDYLYNPDMGYIGRQALHSARMAFHHPITGEQMEFTAPLPEDMKLVMEEKDTSHKK